MRSLIPLRRPGAEVGAHHEAHESFEVEPFDLYGRHHEVTEAEADVAVTRLSEGLHLDLTVRVTVQTTCDRTLEPTDLARPAERGPDAGVPSRDGARGALRNRRRDRPSVAGPRRALRL